MKAYINGIGTVSPQKTFGDVSFLTEPIEYTGNRLTCIEPDYTGWIDARAIRRMSRVIRMGVASAALALKEAAIDKPDAIITGTAFGCLEDTGIFLTKIIDHKEEALNPTPFIQSTHNTIGSQVALLLKCYGYNQTYSHRAFSFEHALEDALMAMNERPQSILVGGIDEVTDLSFGIMDRFDLFKKSVTNLNLFRDSTPGFIQGEGASYFLLSNEKKSSSYAFVRDVATFYRADDVLETMNDFLAKHELKCDDVDLVLMGKNGDLNKDRSYDDAAVSLFPRATIGVYKHLCGEFQTANAFALWLAARMLKENKVPAIVVEKKTDRSLNRILIYNKYLGHHHSLILLESC